MSLAFMVKVIKTRMNLTTKINLILAATFLLGLSVIGVNSYLLTEDSALQQVTDQAELIMLEALAVRSYTVNEIRPLLNQNNDGKFHPQTVPAYSATQTANLLRQSRPNYGYKEAVFNPTNPRDKATPTEEQIIKQFIADPDLTKLIGSQEIDGVKTLYIAYPIRIINPKCLACHSTPEQAPAAMRKIYGDTGGYGWKLNEVVGTQMVVVPYSLPAELARKTFYSFLISLAAIFVVLFLVINITIRKLVLKPVSRLTRMADEVSKGNLKSAEIKVTGKDELAEMSAAFNRMRRSVIKIVQLVRKMKAQNKAGT
jgi:protein-histidine pros-kinase